MNREELKKKMNKFTLEALKELSPIELLVKHHVVVYSKEDIDEINRGLNLIQNVLDKYNKKLMNNNGR